MENHESRQDQKLADLLVAAGLFESPEMEGHLSLAKFMGLTLGNLLVREQRLNQELLKVAIRLQTLISSGMISLELSCRAMRDIVFGRNAADELLSSLDLFADCVRSCRLGELLIDAGLLSQVALGRALVSSSEIKKPLGQTLILQGTLTAELVGAALFAQDNVRAQIIDYGSAVDQLKNVQCGNLIAFTQAC